MVIGIITNGRTEANLSILQIGETEDSALPHALEFLKYCKVSLLLSSGCARFLCSDLKEQELVDGTCKCTVCKLCNVTVRGNKG
eukprot:743493-Pelagomonas_calceolata.AAC.3